MSQEPSELSEPGSNKSFIAADADAIGRAMKVATTQESTQYLGERFAAIINKTPALSVKYNDVLGEIKNYAEVVRLQSQSDTDPLWAGNKEAAVLTKYRAYQECRATEAFKSLMDSIPKGKAIDFDFAMNSTAALLQGFSIDGQPLLASQSDNLNMVFSDWLTMNLMICDNGIIYQSDEAGTIKQSSSGEYLKIDSTDYCQRFTSKDEGGFEFFCAKKSKRLTGEELLVRVTQRAFPGPAPEAAQQAQPT